MSLIQLGDGGSVWDEQNFLDLSSVSDQLQQFGYGLAVTLEIKCFIVTN